MKLATTDGSRRLVPAGTLALALSLGLMVPACTDAGSSWRGVVRDSAGVGVG